MLSARDPFELLRDVLARIVAAREDHDPYVHDELLAELEQLVAGYLEAHGA